ncbi:MAG: cysteine desulfurase [Planctomycetes bacterium]|nr:cysteine desulfurase [Planctomycetota bacterium]
MSHAPHVVAPGSRPGARRVFDVERVREDFPILHQKVHQKPLAYLDNAATTQKPNAVLDAMDQLYRHDYANVHRGVHALSERSTKAYEGARLKVRDFLHAASEHEIVFTRGTTESLNLVAQSWGRKNVGAGDEIVLTAMEHHSNIVPWQLLCEERGARIRVAPIDDEGNLLFDSFEKLLGPRTKLVGVGHVSNALGTVAPVREIVEAAHRRGIVVVVDGAQAVSHLPVDVRALGCDFYAFSSHKLFGPTGTGVLYGREELLDAMPPWQGGGDMISSVTWEKTTYNKLPYKFEAGTPNIAGAIGLGAAIDYVTSIGLDQTAAHEREVLTYATEALRRIPEVRIIGTARDKCGVLSFLVGNVHPHDVGTVLDQEGVAVRAGNHCAQPVMERFGVPATARASFAFYNTRDEVDALVRGIHRVIEVFGR